MKPPPVDEAISPLEVLGGHVEAAVRCARGRLRPRDLRLPALVGVSVLAGGMLAVDAAGGAAVQRTVVEAGALALRSVGYAATLVATGGVAFLTAVHDGRPAEAARLRRLIRAVAVAGIAAAVLAVPVHASVVTGRGFAALVDVGALGAVLGSPFAVAAGLRACGLAGVAWGVGRRGPRSAVAAAGALVAVTSFVLTGHAATGHPRWLVAGATLVHAGTAAVWVGGLVGLTLVLRQRRTPGEAVGGARLVGRFSTVAGASLLALVPTGIVLGVREVGSVGGLLTSGYGRALLVKVVLVAGVVAIGAYNRWRLVPAISRSSSAAWARLLRTVRWEVAGLLTVVVATGVLGRLPPPV